MSAVGGGDISHDGRRIVVFQRAEEELVLVTVARDGSDRTLITALVPGCGYTAPRWSPDDRAIAFQRSTNIGTRVTLDVISIGNGERRPIGHSDWMKGFCWRADGSGLIYSSSRGSTLIYPPVFNLRAVSTNGHVDRQLTFGDQSYVEPDTHHAGRLIAFLFIHGSGI